MLSLIMPGRHVLFALLALVVTNTASSSGELPEESTCTSEGSETSSCLLQSRIRQDAPFAEISASAGFGFTQTKKVSRQVALFSYGNEKEQFKSKAEMVSAMLQQTEERCQSFQAHRIYLRRSTSGLKEHIRSLDGKLRGSAVANISASQGRIRANQTQVSLAEDEAEPDKEGEGEGEGEGEDEGAIKTTQHDRMDKLIQGFIDGQAESEDACHSKLLEARHQLNQLQDLLTELMTEVNTTEEALILYDKELADKLKELAELEKWKDAELEKCRIKKEEDTKMFLKLSAELMEMHQIAMPATSMSIDEGKVHIGKSVKYGDEEKKIEVTPQKRLSLVQDALQAVATITPSGNPHKITIDAAKVPDLVQATQQAAYHLDHCQKRMSLVASGNGNDDQENDEEDDEDLQMQIGEEDENSIDSKEVGLIDSEEETADESEMSGKPKGKKKAKKKAASKQEGKGEVVKAKRTAKKASLKRNKPKKMKKGDTYMTSQGEAASDEKCKEEKEKLEKTYVKAYVELSRLKAEYEMLSKSTACFDAVNEEYNDKAPPLQDAAEKLSKLSKEATEKLKELKPRLEKAVAADKLLRKQVKDLTNECAELPETISDLDKVRDAIRALSLCPGLYRPEFKMPRWAGKWVGFPQNAEKMTDEEQDKAMKWACNEAFEGSRAAEHAEIEERTILDMPVKNDAKEPLMGVCPGCEGDDDDSFKSGHARNCWKTGAPLNEQGVTKTCGKGKKVVLCVVDQSDMREIPGEGEREGAEEDSM
eukprot:gnl/MRDRNA2_/MRDRNA2_87881_c0_seq1.p1 gnl/MRDRNA2_/MRDRNA2_87881_c0~~gnl/MRDRNA2_/MRDRNA2_87881_c0_seq1.p1  ORF type:complete len:764 (+),score=253.97 gnl/MRDRNA2_/MRDRNA2_87881_c0_seq1:95-2386(+)